MSFRYPAGLITASSPVNANYPSGVWTPRQALPYLQNNVWGQDPFFDQTVLLLHGDGTNGAQNNTFLDSSSNNFTITRNGNTTQGTFSPFSLAAGQWSNFFDGTDDRLQIADTAALRPGTSNFTIEAWIYRSVSGVDHTVCAKGAIGAGWQMEITSTNLLSFTNTTTDIRSTGTIPSGQWVHVAAVREGTGANQFKLYINGVNDGTATVSTDFNQTNAFRIGENRSGANDFNGYISNLRYVVGSAVYTGNFTPSTTPLTAVTNTQVLTCQSNSFIDNSTNNFAITLTGTPRVTPFSPFAPTAAYSASVNGGSGYFDGSGDSLTTISSTAVNFGTSDYTIEFFVYFSSLANYITLFDTRITTVGIQLFVGGSGELFFDLKNASNSQIFRIGGAANLVKINEWTHIAICRSGTTTTVYVHGSSIGNNTSDNNSYTSASDRPIIGANYNFSEPFTGYISNLRIVKGTAVYTSNFTPPTAPLTAITNTSLLLNFTNAGILDNTAKNVLETVGNAQIDTAVVKYGTGSMEFDGSGDYLMFRSTPDTTFGTGDFTIEGWFYTNNIANTQMIFERRSALQQRGLIAYIDTSKFNFQAGDTSTGSWEVSLSSATLSSLTWYYFAITRSGNTWRAFIDGSQIGSNTTWSGAVVDETSNWLIGIRFDGGVSFNGFMDDFRITKGIARYTANFVPPIARFPNQ